VLCETFVAAGNLAHWLAVMVTAADRLPLLVVGHFRFAAKLDASGLGAFASLSGASADQLFLDSARPPKTVSIKRPCGVVVSAHTSAKDRKPACLPVICPTLRP
jgi:hypothetical protein